MNVKIGDTVVVGRRRCKGAYRDGFFMQRKEVSLPVGTKIHFPKGFYVRQYSSSGCGSYGSPAKNFWTVTVQEENGQLGVLLPEGDEFLGYEMDDPKKGKSYLHREPEFIPLRLIRFDPRAKIVELLA